MVRGLYTAYTGMLNEQNRLDIITNNLANASTVGYKKEGVTSESFKDVLAIKIRDGSEAYVNKVIGSLDLGVKIGEVYTDFGQGPLRSTGNTFDLAIEGKGFFQIRYVDGDGNETTRYTRSGSFKLTKDGFVTDEDGNKLIGSGGPLQVPTVSGEISITDDGTVYADGQPISQIELADFNDYSYLKKSGENMYEAVEGAAQTAATGFLHQGYTEQSNINVVSEMVQMINITRAYEANQKTIQTTDSLLEKSVNQIGRV